MNLVFAPMNPSYGALSLELYNRYVKNSTATFSIEPLTQEEMDTLLYSKLERFPSYAILADEVFVGYVMLNRYKPREAYDQTAEITVYLDEAYHGKKIGSQALEFMEGIAKSHNFRALLGVICAENLPSIALFEKHGYFKCAHFKEVGKKFNRILDVVIYEKLL